METGADRAAGIVKQQSEVKNERLFQFLEKLPIGDQLWIIRAHECVELVDAKQGVLVRGVTVKKLVLHQTSELTKLWNIAAKKIDAMHQPKRPADFAFSRENVHEDFSRDFGVLVSPGNLLETAAQ